MEVFINCKFARNANLSYENNYLNTENEAIMLCGKNEIKSEEKKSILHNSCYWICYMHGRMLYLEADWYFSEPAKEELLHGQI